MKRLICLTLGFFIFFVGCATIKSTSLMMDGRYSEAERVLEDAVKDPKTASMVDLRQLCFTYLATKNYNKLFDCLNHLETRLNEPGASKSFWGTYYYPEPERMRARAWIDLGDYPKAIKEAKIAYNKAKALKALGKNRAMKEYMMIDSLGSLALAHALMGEENKAKAYIAEIDKVDTYSQIEFRSFITAHIYIVLGDNQKALDVLIKRADKGSIGGILPGYTVFLKEIESNKPLRGSLFNPLAMQIPQMFTLSRLHFELGDVEKAKKGFKKLVGIPQLAQYGVFAWFIYNDLGRIFEMEGDHEQAAKYYGLAIDVIEQQRATIGTEKAKIGFVGDKQSVYQGMISSLFAQRKHKEAFEYVERAKARALVDMLASRKDFASPAGTSQDVSKLISSLEKAEAEASRIIDNEQKQQQRGVVVKLKAEIKSVSPQLESLVTVSTLSTDGVQNLLQNNETLVEYYHQGDDLYAFVMNRETFNALKLDGKGLAKEIEEYRSVIQSPNSQNHLELSKGLYSRLVLPITDMLSNNNLTIVPHGALHYLPFNALNSDNGFMIDRYSIRVLPSASVMKFLKDRPEGHTGNLLAFGNPDLGDPSYDLPGAQNETIAITKDKPKSKLLLRKQATETAVKQYGAGFRYLHFATHGTFDAEKPLSSGLLMAGDSENDGTLTVGELYDLRLPADLVTLSACETALGKVANGDDVVGFTRGFLYAGTSSIVSSLWKVDDKATSILMQQFYKSLKETDKRQALRTAQLKVKDTYNSHPYFWAAFQITGSVQ